MLLLQEQQSAAALLHRAEAEGSAFTEPPSGSLVLPAGSLCSPSRSRRFGAQWWRRGGRGEETGEETQTLFSSWGLFPLLGKKTLWQFGDHVVNHTVFSLHFCNMLVTPADKASWEGIFAPTLPVVTRWAERFVTQPSHPAVYQRGRPPAGCTSHPLQNETGHNSHTVSPL